MFSCSFARQLLVRNTRLSEYCNSSSEVLVVVFITSRSATLSKGPFSFSYMDLSSLVCLFVYCSHLAIFRYVSHLNLLLLQPIYFSISQNRCSLDHNNYNNYSSCYVGGEDNSNAGNTIWELHMVDTVSLLLQVRHISRRSSDRCSTSRCCC